ncbi:MAG: hypothetical protein CMP24_04585 [Rickettsiales bacterium]|nr:hypothetical protein [Rickettsiales bacterium]
MTKKIFLTIASFFLTASVYVGCMKSEIKQLDTKLKNSDISVEKKAEISKLRDLVVSNEHSNSELAFESYEKAMSLLN